MDTDTAFRLKAEGSLLYLAKKELRGLPCHRQLIESYLSSCLPQNCSIEIDYSPKAADNHGRRYCCTIGGQRLPKAARLLLFGRNHCEIDLKGSFFNLSDAWDYSLRQT